MLKMSRYFITFVFLVLTCAAAVFGRDPRNAFYDHAVIRPVLYEGVAARREASSLKDIGVEDVTKLEFQAFGKSFIVDLKENKDLFSPNYKEIYEGEEEIIHQPKESERKCYYKGHMPNIEGSWAAISACDGISGAVYDGNETYLIESNLISRNAEHFIFKASDYKNRNLKCGVEDDMFSTWDKFSKKFQAKKKNSVEYRDGNDLAYMELVVINDYSMFKKYNQNGTAVADRTKQIMNIANTLLSKINIIASIQTTRVWMLQDWIEVTSNARKTLDDFIEFRRDKLNPLEPHDNAVFITGQVYDGGVLGNAYVGAICSDSSAENIADFDDSVNSVGFTTAHEMGHNLGAYHDDDGTKCTCPEEYCVMFPFALSEAPNSWSSCSLDYIAKTKAMGKHHCLENKPPGV